MKLLRLAGGLVLCSALLAPACGGGGGGSSPTAPAPPAPPGPTPVGVSLAVGEVTLPAAQQTSGTGFHEPFSISRSMPASLGPTAGGLLVVALRDSSRPGQGCTSEHPLSGCATVDWSDNPGPRVPPGGVFDNTLTVAFPGGNRRYFLSESGVLADVPDAFSPT